MRNTALNRLVVITRANFLPLTLAIVSAGLAAAIYAHGVFNTFDALLVMIGALLAHASVNVFNNYFDYRSRVDEKTMKTPFSGGVDILVEGRMKPPVALGIGVACLFGAALVGVYFLTVTFYPLLPILAYGLIAICLYTPILSKIHALSEIVAGSGFGFMALGVYVTQTGVVDGTSISILVPISILVGLLLFLNEFPDADADKAAGRRHLVILLGTKRSSWIYVGGLVATYVSIFAAVAARVAPVTVLISVITIPIAYKAARITLNNYDQVAKLIPALASNVMLILGTILLIAVGFLMGIYL